MKRLYLVRHAKSGWGSLGSSDFDRPLNERGQQDAPMMAQRLLDKKCPIDLFVSSPALRAKTTCIAFCHKFGVKVSEVIFKEELYHAPPHVFTQIVVALPQRVSSAAVFSHNPGITQFANNLLPSLQLDHMPTCGIFAVESACNEWKDFFTANKKFLFFEYPKAR